MSSRVAWYNITDDSEVSAAFIIIAMKGNTHFWNLGNITPDYVLVAYFIIKLLGPIFNVVLVFIRQWKFDTVVLFVSHQMTEGLYGW